MRQIKTSNNAPRYFTFDNEGLSFGEGFNDAGGATLQELRDRAQSWLESDGNEYPRQAQKMNVDAIAEFWNLEIIRDHKSKYAFECINEDGEVKKIYLDFYPALLESRDNGYNIKTNGRLVYRGIL